MASRAQLDLEVQMKGAAAAASDMNKLATGADKIDGKLKGVTGSLGGFSAKLSSLPGPIGNVGAGLGGMVSGLAALPGPVGAGIALFGGLTAGLIAAGKAAAEEQVGIQQLNTALANNIPNWDGNTTAVEQYIAKQEQLAFADDALRASLTSLVTQTGSLTEAQALQATAMDLARMGNISLEQATRLVLKADDESFAALGKLGIQIDENATKEEALAAIRTASAGQAEAYANTTGGSLERLQNTFGNIVENIGTAVLGVVEGPLKFFADFLQGPEFQAIADFVGGALATAFGVLGTAFQVLGNILNPIWQNVIVPVWALLTGPEVKSAVEGIATAIGTTFANAWSALQPIMQGVYDNVIKPVFDYFSSPEVAGTIGTIANAVGVVLGGAFEVLKTAAGFVWDNILKPLWDFFTSSGMGEAIGSIANGIGVVLGGAFDVLKTAAGFVWDNVLKPIWDFFTSSGVGEAIGSVANGIGTVLGGAFNVLLGAAQGAWDMIKTVWDFLTGEAATDAAAAGETAVTSFGTGLSTGIVKVAQEAKIAAALAGEDITAGLKEGIERTKDVPFIGMSSALLMLETETLNKLESQSPSQLFSRMGETIPAGLGQGITTNKAAADTAMTGLTTSILGAAQTAFTSANYAPFGTIVAGAVGSGIAGGTEATKGTATGLVTGINGIVSAALTAANYSPFGAAVNAGIAGGIQGSAGEAMLVGGAVAAAGGALGAAGSLASGVKAAFDPLTFDYFKGTGNAIGGGINAGIAATAPGALTAAQTLGNSIIGALNIITHSHFHGIGSRVGNGVRDGIVATTAGAVAAARSLAAQVASAVAGTLGIASPSKVMEEYGKQTALGFARGVVQGTPMAAQATGMMAGAISFGAINIYGTPSSTAPQLGRQLIDEVSIRLRNLQSTQAVTVRG